MPVPPSAYDSVPYPNRAFAQTHPDRLAAMGTLFGMTPAPVEHCRVLELACGDGSNLIPMAYGLPGSEFRGMDLAANPVKSANEIIERLGLKNVRVEQMDLLEIDEGFGPFDYIIAHGVYSWVPERVQEKILAICAANLAVNGIAFISYNTHPAGRIRQMLRELAQMHVGAAGDSRDTVRAAREFAEAIVKAAREGSAWKSFLREEFKMVFERDDRVVFHDDLGDCFAPVSFVEFAQRAGSARLQILGDAKLRSLAQPDVSSDGLEALKQLAGDDPIAYEQYLDFATYRRFRQTLLCHAETQLKRDGVLQEAKKLLVASPLKITAEQVDGAVEFTNTRGRGTIQTNNPHLVAILRQLEKTWPRAEPLAELLKQVRSAALEAIREDIASELVKTLISLATQNLVDLRAHHFRIAGGVSEKPAASLLARIQVHAGSLVTTLLHTHVELEDEVGRKFLQLLDGTRCLEDIAEALAPDGNGAASEGWARQVRENLERFYRMGLLIA